MGAREDLVLEGFCVACVDLRSGYSEDKYRIALDAYTRLPEKYKCKMAATLYNSLPKEVRLGLWDRCEQAVTA
jgi:hypothetical protein